MRTTIYSDKIQNYISGFKIKNGVWIYLLTNSSSIAKPSIFVCFCNFIMRILLFFLSLLITSICLEIRDSFCDCFISPRHLLECN